MREHLERLLSELKKLTPKERAFVLNCVANRTGNKNIDQRNFEFDLTLNKFRNARRMLRVYDMLYELTNEEIMKLAEKLRR